MPFYESVSVRNYAQEELVPGLGIPSRVRRLQTGWNQGPSSPFLDINYNVTRDGILVRASQKPRIMAIMDIGIIQREGNDKSMKMGGSQWMIARRKGSGMIIHYPVNADGEVKVLDLWYETPIESWRNGMRRKIVKRLIQLEKKLTEFESKLDSEEK